MDFKNDFLGYNFTWFIGEVESRFDPLKVGRVKVRCFGWHPSKEELPTDDLPWAQTIQPVTAPAAAPTGLSTGVWVFGFFMDGDKAQRPMIMGQIPGYRYNADGTGESELPRAARVEENYESPQSKLRKDSRITGISLSAHEQTTWDEPEEPQDKEYPFVQTVASEAGFMTETIYGPLSANTGGFETRQVTYDCNGGYDERRSPSGDKIVKVIGDNYEIVCGSSFVNVKGDINLTVDGSMRTNIAGDYEINVGGNMYTTVGKNDSKYVIGSQKLGIIGTRDTHIGGVSYFVGPPEPGQSLPVGDKKVVALGGVSDTVLLGGRIITTTGDYTRTILGTSKLSVVGAQTDEVAGARTVSTTGLLTMTSATHAVEIGAGTFTSTGSLSVPTITCTTLTASGTVTGSQVVATTGPVTLSTHKHPTAGTGSPSSPTPGT